MNKYIYLIAGIVGITSLIAELISMSIGINYMLIVLFVLTIAGTSWMFLNFYLEVQNERKKM